MIVFIHDVLSVDHSEFWRFDAFVLAAHMLCRIGYIKKAQEINIAIDGV
jgi:hypothetical protein